MPSAPASEGTDSECRSNRPRVFLLDRISMLYTAIAVPSMVYCSLLHQLAFGSKFAFLPLMLTSTYAALGVMASWFGFIVVHLIY